MPKPLRRKRKPLKRKRARRAAKHVSRKNAEKKDAEVKRRLTGPVKPLTAAELAAGTTHEPHHIDGADHQMVPLPLRESRARAYIVECYCRLCDARRTRYWRS